MFVYTGSIVWLLEFLGNNTNVQEPIPRKIGIVIFFSLFGDSYTANLATMLTVEQLKPTINRYRNGSFIKDLLEDLHFDTSKIKAYNSRDEFYNVLSKGTKNGGIAAFVHEIPYINTRMVEPFYKTAGLGYSERANKKTTFLTQAFPKGSPLLGDMSKAILNITEGDTIMQIEKKWIGYQNDCKSVDSVVGPVSDPDKLSIDNFKGLFILTGVVSTSSLIIAIMIYLYEKNKSMAKIQIDQSGDDLEENQKLQEGNEGGRAEENNQLRETGHIGQQIKTGEKEMHNGILQISGVRHNDSIFILRERNHGARVAPVSSSSPRVIMIVLLISLVISSSLASSAAAQSASGGSVHIGVILDLGTLVGKIARTSVLLAVDDFYAAHPNYRTRLVLHNFNVQAIIGPQKSSQASFLSDLGNISQVPIISFTATSPGLYSDSLPYFIRATLDDSAQVNSIASLIKAYGWRDVVPIYEDTIYGRGIIPYLVDALQGIDSRIPYRSVIPLSASNDQIAEELYKLKTMPSRVFVVHMSSALASLLFTKAKEVGMMDKGYVWIMTDGITNIIDSLNPSVVEAMNGALGIKFYVSTSAELDIFTKRWNRRFQLDNPYDPPLQLSVFGLWGYDTIWTVAQAAEKTWATNITTLQKQIFRKNLTGLGALESSGNDPDFLKAILQNKFKGLSGYFDLSNRQLQTSTFEIINVDGKGWRQIAFWTTENGISKQFNPTRLVTKNSVLVSDLRVTWPGGSKEIPKGWEIPSGGNKLKVGVHKSGYPEFMNYSKDPTTGEIKATGLAIDVFEEATRRVPYALPFEYVASDVADRTSRSYEESSSYDDFVYQVYLKKYDLAIGDITIRYNRSFYVDFTLPYTESGVAMVVPVKEATRKNALIFLKPLSLGMWLCSLAFFFGTGGVVWLLEHLDILIVWLFFFLVLTSSYTASLASMLTVQQLNPTVTDIHDLLRNGDYVGYHRGSYVQGFLEGLGFDKSKIKAYDTPDDFRKALSSGSDNGGIAALVHEVPYIKLFLAKHCEDYTMIGPIYKTAGFGFAFPKGSPLLGDISKAILNITEGDTIIQIEKKWIGDKNNCNNVGAITSSGSITLGSFWGLFLFIGSVSVCCLFIGLIIYFKERHQRPDLDVEMRQPGNEHGENAHVVNPEAPYDLVLCWGQSCSQSFHRP
uniref:Ionotropic glutamate receptor C-terminal domain-containing protein n=1 Tax=Leersia perrieri TaxID=77586 RepID=A0A0D9XDY6_9ORYZ